MKIIVEGLKNAKGLKSYFELARRHSGWHIGDELPGGTKIVNIQVWPIDYDSAWVWVIDDSEEWDD